MWHWCSLPYLSFEKATSLETENQSENGGGVAYLNFEFGRPRGKLKEANAAQSITRFRWVGIGFGLFRYSSPANVSKVSPSIPIVCYNFILNLFDMEWGIQCIYHDQPKTFIFISTMPAAGQHHTGKPPAALDECSGPHAQLKL